MDKLKTKGLKGDEKEIDDIVPVIEIFDKHDKITDNSIARMPIPHTFE